MSGIWNSLIRNFSGYYLWLANVTPDWDFIKAFFRSPLFNVVALLPIIGFIVVQASSATEAIVDNEVYSNYIEIFIDRIVGIYWGSYNYLLAYGVYLFDPSPMVRSSKDTDDFLGYVQRKNTPRLTVSFIFQAMRGKYLFGSSSKETEEFADCAQLWMRRVLALDENEIEHAKEVEYILGRISGKLEPDPQIQADLETFRSLLLDLSVKFHKQDPWIQELNDNISHIFYRENARRPNFSRLLCLFWIASGTLQIFGYVLLNHLKIMSAF